MSNQYSTPCLVSGEKSPSCLLLKRIPIEGRSKDGFDERWLQSVIHSNPELIPIDQIEPIFTPLIPLCTETTSRAGRADNLFINSKGLLTIVECKLFRNPQARREVVAQILDYAKELASWTYEQLERKVLDARADGSTALLDIVRQSTSEPIEDAGFIDSVNSNLKRGRLLLLIAGDGIRSDVEDLTSFLDSHAHLNFTISLIELAVFALPAGMPHKYLISPRVLIKTSEHVRAVVRFEGAGSYEIYPSSTPNTREPRGGARQSVGLTEQAILEALNIVSPRLGDKLIEFAEELRQNGMTVECTKQSLNIYYPDEPGNLGMCNIRGLVEFQRANERPEYLNDVAKLIPGAIVRESNPMRIEVNGNHPSLADLLKQKGEWIRAMRKEVERVQQRR